MEGHVGTYKLAWIDGHRAYSVMFDDTDDLCDYIAQNIKGPYTIFELEKASGTDYTWHVHNDGAGKLIKSAHRFRFIIFAVIAYLVYFRIQALFK